MSHCDVTAEYSPTDFRFPDLSGSSLLLVDFIIQHSPVDTLRSKVVGVRWEVVGGGGRDV